MNNRAKYIRSQNGKYVFQIGKIQLHLSSSDIEANNLSLESLHQPGDFIIDYKSGPNNRLKINYMSKDIFGSKDENFAIRVNKSPVYKNFEKPQSQLIKEIELPVFNKNDIDRLALRQLIHSQAACEELPLCLEMGTDDIEQQAEDFRQNHEGYARYKTDWRVISGLGGPSMFETSMTLHHIYGFPFLPASSVKGIVRSWLVQEYFPVTDNDKNPLINAEHRALKSKEFCLLFGCPATTKAVLIKDGKPVENGSGYKYSNEENTGLLKDHIGNIVFFDAFPSMPPTIEPDIINPHYSAYYNDANGTTPPADWQNPVPIFFLTVKNASFQFLFGIRRGIAKEELKILKEEKIWFKHPENATLNKTGNAVTVLKELLGEALKYHGIGAKTSAGYGLMTKI